MTKANVGIVGRLARTGLCVHRLQEAESARPTEQGRAGVQEREVAEAVESFKEAPSNSIPTFHGAPVSGDGLHEQYIPGAESPENSRRRRPPNRSS